MYQVGLLILLSSNYLIKDRVYMSEKSLNSALTVKEILKMYNNHPVLLPITPKFLSGS